MNIFTFQNWKPSSTKNSDKTQWGDKKIIYKINKHLLNFENS